ncbi:unnamed protein product [Blepharisma stoltei]|uniref:LAGLIDADG homing endonuclease n=1 Tax=Blepharisma stoltei TaxID=1481888 RepID=A0AAU9IDA7_9CILI|nr:unnamed protein product [Blepharisma stoltei]
MSIESFLFTYFHCLIMGQTIINFIMENQIRLCEWTPISLPGQFGNFQWISKAEPRQSSFYLAIGAAYFGCILRLRNEESLLKYTFEAFAKYTKLSEQYIYLNPELHSRYREMVSILLNERSKLSLSWLKSYMENNDYRGAEAMEFGMRCLFATCMKFWKSEQESIVRNDEFVISDKAFYLTHFANFMKVHILLIKREEHDYFERLNGKSGPLLCLFYEDGYYSVIYHAEMIIHQDEQRSRLLNLSRFPFYHCPHFASKIDVIYGNPEIINQTGNSGIINQTESTHNDGTRETSPY